MVDDASLPYGSQALPQNDNPSEPYQIPAPEASRAPAAVSDEPINVINPEGKLVSIPKTHLPDALNVGYRVAADHDIAHHIKQEKYSSLPEQLMTGAEGLASSATLGLSPLAETATFGIPGATGITTNEDIRNREEINPGVKQVGELAGLVIPGSPAAKALTKVGEAGAKAVGLGAEGAGVLSRIGSAAVKGTIENAIFQSGNEVEKMIIRDPNQSAETAVALSNIGLSGLLGGAISGVGLGVVPELWKATAGSKTGGVLKALANKAGGIEGVVPDAMESAIEKSGVQIAPEVKAGMSDNPYVTEMFEKLRQTDTNKSGIELQKSFKEARQSADEALLSAVGRTPDTIPEEISKYQAGKSFGNTLAEEYEAQISPLSKEFEDLKNKYSKVELTPDLPDAPGTITKLQDKIAKLAFDEGWTASPSSDIMKEISRVQKELPLQKNVRDLTNYIKAVGDNMQSDPLNGSLRRAGGAIKSILKEAEAEVIGAKLGAEEGDAALLKYKSVRDAYAKQSQLHEALDSRLHAKGSTGGYARALKEMAQTDGETLLRRAGGDGDADMLNFLQKTYPKAAQELRDYHLNNLLKSATQGAEDGMTINPTKLNTLIGKMSPEMRDFVIPKGAQDQIKAVSEILDKFKRPNYNFSNTARVEDKLGGHMTSSVLGIAAMAFGHNPLLGVVLAPLAKYIGRDIPDAMRLSMLKFLGSGTHIESSGFKAMHDYYNTVLRGEEQIKRSVKSVFKAGVEVLPQSRKPDEKDRKKLDKAITTMHEEPSKMFDTAKDVGHYLPDHAAAAGQIAANAVGFLKNLRPNTAPQNPLDSPSIPSQMQKSAYYRALDIAEQPLIVLDKIKQGTLTQPDMVALKSMYPNLYTKLVQNLTNEMIDVTHKGDIIPYKTRLSMSLFMGQALDSTMTPGAITAAQPQAQQAAQNQQMAPQRPKHSMTALNKLPKQYETKVQAAERDESSRG